MKTKIIISLLILGLIGAAVGYYLFTMKVPGLENVDPDYSLTANELFDAFEADEAASLAKYEGKVIAVSGKIDRIKTTETNTNVTLYAENALAGGVNCSFNGIVSGISEGDRITIKGRCQGFLMDVVLNNCSK